MAFMFETLSYVHVSIVLTSLLICLSLVKLARRYPRLTGQKSHTKAVQSAHKVPTPRVGGIGIFAAFSLGLIFSPQSAAEVNIAITLSAFTLFIVGLLEDLGYEVSPKKRLIAAILSSVIAIVLLGGVFLHRADIIYVDAIMPYKLVGIPITIFVCVGILNGFNLIDGVNGLSSITAMTAALALFGISQNAGADGLSMIPLFLAAAVFGFFILNYPSGLIFLGDAGAYSIGFILSWIGIVLISEHHEVTTWAILLTVFWPAADASLAIYRRSRRQTETMQPDRMHVHQVAMRGLEILYLGRTKRHISNPLSTVILAPFIVCPALTGVYFWNEPLYAFAALICFAVLFFITYTFAVRAIHKAAS